VQYRSITRRWVLNSLGVVTVVLILLEIGIAFGVKNYYYSAANNVLSSSDYINYSKMNENANDAKVNFRLYVRSLVENFEDKDQIEMMALNSDGMIVVTSSGFSYDSMGDMPDYEQAMTSADGIGHYIGPSESGEKIMALTRRLVPFVTSEYSAVRYVISLEKIDHAITVFMLILTGIMVLVLGLILLSNSFFIKSIVIPVRELGDMARQFAGGDMSARIIKKSNDEIGELCDILNYMADEIQKTEQMKNEFISSVSHELRTPLTAIKGWGETLMTMPPGDDAMTKKGMRVILKETERLSGMVEELLDFSRMQNGRFTLVKTKMDLLAEIDDTVLVYTERARRDNQTLLINEPENLSFVFGDKNRIKQVFINVIDNALKYSDAGGVITVDVKEKDGFAVVRVSDTGCGIAAKDLPHIKEKFFKANSTRRGSGIGLAVADEIVQLHGGDITVESTLGVGTTVTIRLPVMQKDEERKAEITVQNERSTESAETEKRKSQE